MKNFLLVDDDADDASLFEEALRVAGRDLHYSCAVNGRDAMRKLEGGEITRPDIIFLDINMPIVNGWELLAYLKKEEAYKNIPVVIYTTSSHKREIEMAKNSGASSFLVKPTDFGALTDILKSFANDALAEGPLHF